MNHKTGSFAWKMGNNTAIAIVILNATMGIYLSTLCSVVREQNNQGIAAYNFKLCSFRISFLGVVHFRGSSFRESMDWGSMFCPSPPLSLHEHGFETESKTMLFFQCLHESDSGSHHLRNLSHRNHELSRPICYRTYQHKRCSFSLRMRWSVIVHHYIFFNSYWFKLIT